MKSYFGSYQSSPTAPPVESTVLVFEKNLNIGYRNTGNANQMVNWLLKDLDISFDFPAQSTRIRNRLFPGQQLTIPGKEVSQTLEEQLSENRKPWIRRSHGREWIRNSMLLVLILGFLFLLYLLIVPWLSEKMAMKISVRTEQQLGEAVYNAMGLTSQEDSAASIAVNDFFARMDVATAYPVKITVINSSTVNAFALPGGRIVVYSALLQQLGSYPELAALLSHEFTHINNRHATRSVFRRLGSKVFLSLLFGRLGAVTSIVVDHADNLKSLTYSRKLEKEADIEGLNLLMQRKIDPAGFEALFTHLQAAASSNALPEFLGSHPDINKRVRYIRAASVNAGIAENEQLKSIFQTLKK